MKYFFFLLSLSLQESNLEIYPYIDKTENNLLDNKYTRIKDTIIEIKEKLIPREFKFCRRIVQGAFDFLKNQLNLKNIDRYKLKIFMNDLNENIKKCTMDPTEIYNEIARLVHINLDTEILGLFISDRTYKYFSSEFDNSYKIILKNIESEVKQTVKNISLEGLEPLIQSYYKDRNLKKNNEFRKHILKMKEICETYLKEMESNNIYRDENLFFTSLLTSLQKSKNDLELSFYHHFIEDSNESLRIVNDIFDRIKDGQKYFLNEKYGFDTQKEVMSLQNASQEAMNIFSKYNLINLDTCLFGLDVRFRDEILEEIIKKVYMINNTFKSLKNISTADMYNNNADHIERTTIYLDAIVLSLNMLMSFCGHGKQ